ncbi:thioredoxin family protein [Sphingobacterium sp.]|uniref:TlpA family protein disulfide reductase n=1 Tax=Sphingobacterium sp. TaxID=341027 RepID=UPI0028A86FEA|nr:thioredoxin family protein [Sphingobacterium sp.]
MEKKIILCMVLLVLVLCPMVQIRAQAVFKGKVDPSLDLEYIEVRYAVDRAQVGKIYNLGIPLIGKVESGEFQLDFPDIDGPFYLLIYQFKSKRADVAGMFIPILSHTFLMESTDTLDFNITRDGVLLADRSSPSLKCQMDLIGLNAKNLKDRISLTRSYRLEDTVDLETRALAYFQELQIFYDRWEGQIREVVRGHFKDPLPEIAEAILYNKIGDTRRMEIAAFGHMAERAGPELRKIAIRHYLEHYMGRQHGPTFAAYRGGAPGYASFLGQKVVYDLLVGLNLVERNMTVQLEPVVDIIGKRYTGRLYDEVVFAAYLDRASKRFVDEKTYSILTSRIRDPEMLQYVAQQRDRTVGGSKFYEFELQDQNGGRISNRDLEGKVVIYDFWFTGCRGCITLHRYMGPIKARFRDDPNVVFLSICVDRKEEMWKGSLKSGNYADMGDTNLWVGEMGDNHPMVQHFSINSYPTQIIVDGNNRIVAMNPPDVRKKGEEEAFVEMVKEALERRR